MDLTTIQDILEERTLTNGEVQKKYNISRAVHFAITQYGKGMQLEAIRYKLQFIQPGMRSDDIARVME